MRVNFNMPDELLKRLDEYAKENYISRSALMCQACDYFLTTKEVQKLLKQMTETMRRIAETNEINEQTQKEFEKFNAFASMLSGSF